MSLRELGQDGTEEGTDIYFIYTSSAKQGIMYRASSPI